MSSRSSEWLKEAKIISKILSNAPNVDKKIRIGPEEFKQRQEKVMEAIEKKVLMLVLFILMNTMMDSYNFDKAFAGVN